MTSWNVCMLGLVLIRNWQMCHASKIGYIFRLSRVISIWQRWFWSRREGWHEGMFCHSVSNDFKDNWQPLDIKILPRWKTQLKWTSMYTYKWITKQYNATQSSTTQHKATQHDTIQHNTMQYSTIKYIYLIYPTAPTYLNSHAWAWACIYT